MCWHLACVCVGTLSKSMKILEDAEETRDTDMPGMPQGGAFKALVGAVGKRVASQGVESVLVRVRDSEVSPSCACSQRGRCFEAVGVLEPAHSAAPQLPELPQQPKPAQQRRRLPESRPRQLRQRPRPLQRLPEFRGTPAPGSKAAEAREAGVFHEAARCAGRCGAVR